MELTTEFLLQDVERAITSGVEFLKRSQQPSGAFALYRSYDPTLEKDCVDEPSLFTTALIAYSLTFSDCATAREIVDRTAAYFLEEMVGRGSGVIGRATILLIATFPLTSTILRAFPWCCAATA
jgi:hypothetical protein